MRYLTVSILALLMGIGVIGCSSGGGDDDDSSGDDGADDAADDDADDDTGDNSDDNGDDDADDDATDDVVTDDDVGMWTDPATGLTWQSDSTVGDKTWQDAIAYCEHLTFDGFGDWHLPTISELRTLIRGCGGTEAGGSCGVTDTCLESTCQDDSCFGCDSGAGPNDGCYSPSEILGHDCDQTPYWSSSAVPDAAESAWNIFFRQGQVFDDYTGTLNSFLCVRDDNAGDDDTNDAWTDSDSNLTWQAYPSEEMEWPDAIAYCESFTLAGYNDWRLPTLSQLRTIIRGCPATATDGSCGATDSCLESSCADNSCSGCPEGEGPADGCYWPSELAGECAYYWPSSELADYEGYGWYVGFSAGNVSGDGALLFGRARCVR